MIIETVKTQENSYFVNGTMSVPNDPANKDYQAILDWINEGNTPEGPDVIEPDYVALRTGVDGYASTGDQLGMIADGTQVAHVTDVKTRFPKTITGGTTIGDVPQDILDAAANKLFAQQVVAYTAATARIAQYILSVGREEVVESQPTGEQVYNEETFEMEDVMADFVVVTSMEPLEATVEVTTVDHNNPEAEPTVETVANPLIVADDAERAEAQAVIDATPTPVKEHVDAEE
jgi:hypothetical protein